MRHSLSPLMHNSMFWARRLPFRYLAIDVAESDLAATLEAMGRLAFRGFNVTIPHKGAVARLLAGSLSEEASVIGAVNTVVARDDGWLGLNTDVYGVEAALKEAGADGGDALLIGAGGTARAVLYALSRIGVRRVIIVNRTPERAQALSKGLCSVLGMDSSPARLDEARRYSQGVDIVINSTSIGLDPSTDEPPLRRGDLRSGQVVLDVVYSPLGTRLIHEAMAAGCRAVDGVSMLVHQGAEAFRLWTGVEPDVGFMERVVRARLRRLALEKRLRGV